MSYGTTPTSTTTLGANQFPVSAVASRDTPSGNLTTLMGADGAYVDSNSNPMTAALMQIARQHVVQKNNAVTGSAGKTLTCQFTNKVQTGNAIVVLCGMGEVETGGGSPITLAVTDSNSNTFAEVTKGTQSTTLESAVFLSTRITGDSSTADTVTVTIAGAGSSNTAIWVQIYEVWGLISNNAAAISATSIGSNAGSTSVSTAAVTPYTPFEIAFTAISAAGGTITAGTNWTLDSGSLSPTGGGVVSGGAETILLSTLAPVTPTATLSSSNAWAACTATFKVIAVPIEGSISIPDGWDITHGAKADTAITDSTTTNSTQSFIKGLVKILSDIWDSTNHLFHQNLKQVGGTATDTNSGNKSAGTLRVVIATDQPSLTNAQPVSQSGTWTAGSNSATGAGVPANAFYSGVLAKTALPTAGSDGNLTGMMGDKFGRPVVLHGSIRDLRATQTTTISNTTSETTIFTAVASTFLDVVMFIFSNTSATATRIDIRDTTAGTVLGSVYVPAGDMRGFAVPGETIPQTSVNTNWTCQCATAVTDIRVYALVDKNK